MKNIICSGSFNNLEDKVSRVITYEDSLGNQFETIEEAILSQKKNELRKIWKRKNNIDFDAFFEKCLLVGVIK